MNCASIGDSLLINIARSINGKEKEMLNPQKFTEIIKQNGIEFFTGVPDSLLKDFCYFVAENLSEKQHVISANEGSAVAIASGRYLSTKKLSLVYLQNSGIGNLINPLMSLACKEVYAIPMMLMIGHRGAPGVKDEPQHMKQGKITTELLKTMGIPFEVLSDDIEKANKQVESLAQKAIEEHTPVALLVNKNTFEEYKPNKSKTDESLLSREKAIEIILSKLDQDCIYLSTTGKTSRELYELRVNSGIEFKDFINVGAMGHVSQVAMGVALGNTDKKIVCLDGDGSVIMHMGGLGTIAKFVEKNFCHIVFNNGCHESVGGQPTYGNEISFDNLAATLGFKNTFTATNENELVDVLAKVDFKKSPAFIEVKVRPGSRKDLGRPKSTPIENKNAFMELF